MARIGRSFPIKPKIPVMPFKVMPVPPPPPSTVIPIRVRPSYKSSFHIPRAS